LGEQLQGRGRRITYAAKLSKQETRIDWSLSAAEVHNHIRGLSPFPGAWCEMELGGKAERVKILRSALGGRRGRCREV
jgi:methionyl-tRNA formyltransferase